jgi:hypothetical protein
VLAYFEIVVDIDLVGSDLAARNQNISKYTFSLFTQRK